MRLNVIGGGNVGRTLCRLWHSAGTLTIAGIRNRSLESAQEAVAFIGAGSPVADYAELPPSDLFLIGVPDDAIAACAEELAVREILKRGDIVFHCSGSLSSTVLAPIQNTGAHVGSVHPIHSFASPARSVERFAGTFCAVEGDPEAVGVLRPIFTAIGGDVFEIDGSQKTIYHTGTVIASNYLVALLEMSARCLERAGIERERALAVLRPLVSVTAENVFERGTVQALSGPIARGDDGVVARQIDALAEWDAESGEALNLLYRELGLVALALATQRDVADANSLARIRTLLETD